MVARWLVLDGGALLWRGGAGYDAGDFRGWRKGAGDEAEKVEGVARARAMIPRKLQVARGRGQQ